MSITRVRETFAAFCLAGLVSGLLAFAPTAEAAGGPLVYGINPFGNDASDKGLRPFDAATGQNAPGLVITNAGGPVAGAVESGNGLARHPTTGLSYAILKIAGRTTRVLATVDLSNGQATTIHETGRQFAGITFSPTGTLYGVTGSGDTGCAGCLYTIDLISATPAFVKQLTEPSGPSGGHAIAFNTDDGLIYHATGSESFGSPSATNRIFETFDPSNSSVVGVGYLGPSFPEEVIGMGYDAAIDRFIMTDIDRNIWSVTPGGNVAFQNPTTQWLRGLIVTTDPVPPNAPPIAVDDAASVIRDQPLNPNSATLDPLANDSDPEDDTITLQSFTQPGNGTVTQPFGQVLSYVPDPGYCNDGLVTDDFSYTLNGGDTATVEMTVVCQHRVVYGFSGQELSTVERTSGVTLGSVALDVVAGPVSGDSAEGFALAIDPVTNGAYATVNVNPSNDDVLGRLDMSTGELTGLRRPPQQIDGLAFSTRGKLYGISDNSNPCRACLYKFNKSTGAAKRLTPPGRLSDDGSSHAIAFNPADGMIYHATGEVFEKIDPTRGFAVTDVPYTGPAPFDAYGLTYDPITGDFVLLDALGEIWDVTPTGSATPTGIGLGIGRGLAVGARRTLGFSYSRTETLFSGQITSFEDGCVDGRPVSIFKKKKGPDLLIGQPTSEPDGSYELDMAANPGKYYGVVDAEPTPLSDCMSARSGSVTVR